MATKMGKWLLAILISSGLFACQEIAPVRAVSNGRMTIIDSTGKAEQRMPYDSADNMAHYPVYFIGEVSDIFHLGAQPVSMFSTRKLDETTLR